MYCSMHTERVAICAAQISMPSVCRDDLDDRLRSHLMAVPLQYFIIFSCQALLMQQAYFIISLPGALDIKEGKEMIMPKSGAI